MLTPTQLIAGHAVHQNCAIRAPRYSKPPDVKLSQNASPGQPRKISNGYEDICQAKVDRLRYASRDGEIVDMNEVESNLITHDSSEPRGFEVQDQVCLVGLIDA